MYKYSGGYYKYNLLLIYFSFRMVRSWIWFIYTFIYLAYKNVLDTQIPNSENWNLRNLLANLNFFRQYVYVSNIQKHYKLILAITLVFLVYLQFSLPSWSLIHEKLDLASPADYKQECFLLLIPLRPHRPTLVQAKIREKSEHWTGCFTGQWFKIVENVTWK